MNDFDILPEWQRLLQDEWHQSYFQSLNQFVKKRRQQSIVYPNAKQELRALKLTDYHQVKVVILGQDPYHGEGQAHGLSFSVPHNIPLPPSLRNIFKELVADIGCDMPTQGDLTSWAKQGVLLLNTVLTVEAGKANSHQQQGWEVFTDKIITLLNDRITPIIFVLWGKPAQRKQSLITGKHHVILTTPHPSPLSAYRGFFGSRPFSTINEQLKQWQQLPIHWQLP